MKPIKKRLIGGILLLCASLNLASCAPVAVNHDAMQLSNPNADETTKAVYGWLCETFETQVITGQQESTWMSSPEYEMDYILETTGKLPALRGFDFLNDDFDGVVSRAEDWWQRGGLVTIGWHCASDFTRGYENCLEDEISDWEAVLTEGTEENKAFIANMDHAGEALKRLQDAGVPVLWRPFHEFDGRWFWWGKAGSEIFKRLWIMMYEHFTYDLELNNLIWVLGYSQTGKKMAEWYPGDEYCDIVGSDSYHTEENGAEKGFYRKLLKITNGSKPLCFHECGVNPTEEQFREAPWSYFMTWHTDFVTDKNSKEALTALYNSDYFITLDEMPDFP